jgi:hypothetical protein
MEEPTIRTIKVYAVIAKRSKLLKLDRMGTNENPYYSIHPYTKEGLKYAESNKCGLETVVLADLSFVEPPKKEKFKECFECAKKPGSPQLCPQCLWARENWDKID